MVQDTRRGRLGWSEISTPYRIRPQPATYQDDDPKTTSREQQVDPVLNLVNLDVVTG